MDERIRESCVALQGYGDDHDYARYHVFSFSQVALVFKAALLPVACCYCCRVQHRFPSGDNTS